MSRLITKIRTLLFPPKPTGLPYNLTPEQLSVLRELSSLQAWKVYQSLLDVQINLLAEQLLATGDDVIRGNILGLRKAGTLITEILRQQDSEDARRTRTDRAAGERLAERELSLYGTRYGRSG